jgi:tripartite-type tricarboxylate transporter receptor subunit TctC
MRTTVAVAALTCLSVSPAWAQDKGGSDNYPARPIRFIIPYAVGGGTDILGRIVGLKLSERLGQQVVVDNRPGGTAIVGSELLARSAPDGYTMMTANIAHGANAFLNAKLPYDTLKDFAPVTLMAMLPSALVIHPSVAARSVKEFVALAKAKPGGLSYGTAGAGSANHLCMERFKIMTGTDILHVPYKGGGPAVIDLVAGQIHAIFLTVPPALPHIKSGKLVAIAISSAKRSGALPDVPTVAESGVPGYEVNEWQGIIVRAGTPAAVVTRLHREVTGVLQLPDVRERITGMGAEVRASSTQEFDAFIRSELRTWEKVLKQGGVGRT